MSQNDDEIVNVPVPRRHLTLIIQTLAKAMTTEMKLSDELEEKRVPASAASRSGTRHLQDRGGKIVWTADNLRKLRTGLRTPAPIAMLDMAASHPGEATYFLEVSSRLGQEEKQTRAQIATLTKAIKREFLLDYDDAEWPVKVDWDTRNGKMYYVMDEETASAWLESSRN